MLPAQKTTIRDLTILIGTTTVVLASAGLAPALPAIASAFEHLPNAELLVRLMLTMPALLTAISAPFAGILSDRWGRKPLIVVALILYGLAGAAGYVLDSLYAILLSRAVLGIAIAGILTGFVTLITDYYSGTKLNQFTGYVGAFAGFSGVGYEIISGYLADLGWRFPFLLHLIAFVILVSVLLTVDETRLWQHSEPQEVNEVQAKVPLPTILLIYAIALVSMLLLFTLIIHIPFYLTGETAASNSQVGLALSLQALPRGFAALLYSKLKAGFSFQMLVALVFLALGINHVVAFLTSSYALVVAGLFVGGFGFGLLMPNLISWLASITPPVIRGRAIGGLDTALYLGQFTTPILTQPLVTQIGSANTFGIAGGVSLLLAAALVGSRLLRGHGLWRNPASIPPDDTGN